MRSELGPDADLRAGADLLDLGFDAAGDAAAQLARLRSLDAPRLARLLPDHHAAHAALRYAARPAPQHPGRKGLQGNAGPDRESHQRRADCSVLSNPGPTLDKTNCRQTVSKDSPKHTPNKNSPKQNPKQKQP